MSSRCLDGDTFYGATTPGRAGMWTAVFGRLCLACGAGGGDQAALPLTLEALGFWLQRPCVHSPSRSVCTGGDSWGHWEHPGTLVRTGWRRGLESQGTEGTAARLHEVTTQPRRLRAAAGRGHLPPHP